MTISSTYAPVQYIGNGVTTTFSFPYVFYDDTDIIVTLTLISTGEDTVQVNPTNYSLTGGDGDVGNVVFVSAPSSSYRITIERSIPYEQGDNYVENQAFPANTIETAFDKAVVRDQQLAASIDASLKFPATLSGSLVGVLPQPEDGKLLIWDGTAGTVGNATFAEISTSIDTVLTSLASTDILVWNGSAFVNQTIGETLTATGILKRSGTTISAATAGTDYYAPGGTDVAVADGGTNISSYTAGDTLYASAGTTLSKLAIGSTGRPMVSTGTAPSWGNAINLQASSSASGSTVENTSIPSGVRRIKIFLAGLSSNGTSAIQVQIGSGSYETTGYTGSVTQASASVASSNLSSGFAIAQTVSAASVFSGIITLEHMGSNLWVAQGMLGRSDSAVTCYFGGHKSISGVLDRVRINCGADTFDAGTVAFAWEF